MNWYITPNENITNYNSLDCIVNLSNIGNHVLNCKITHDNKTWNATNFNFNVDKKPSLLLPINEDLLIDTQKPLKYCGWVPIKKDKDFLLCNKLNEYGVLNTFSLITKIYADSTIMNSNDFNNINVSLLENNNYDYFKFEITGQSNKKINGFSRFPFAALIQGWSGYDLNANNNVKVVFEYMRSPTSTMNGTNKFDLSDINFGDNLGGASTITWKKTKCWFRFTLYERFFRNL